MDQFWGIFQYKFTYHSYLVTHFTSGLRLMDMENQKALTYIGQVNIEEDGV
jgi:hypothetical protein